MFKSLEKRYPKERAHLLGQLEIHKKYKKFDQLFQLIQNYFHKYKSRPVCYDDLKGYLKYLYDNQQLEYLNKLNNTFNNTLENEKGLDSIINAAKLKRMISFNETVENEEMNGYKFSEIYEKYLPEGMNVPETDLHPADDLAVLAGLAFISAYHKCNDFKYIHKAICVMEFGLSNSKRSYRLKLLLIRLYRLIASPQLALDHNNSLRIQSIQQDTLSHWTCSRLSTFCAASDGDMTCLNIIPNTNHPFLGFWGEGERESNEMILKLFKQGTYSYLEDFITFANRIKQSLNKQLLKTENIRMKVLRDKLESDEIKDMLTELRNVKIDTLVDNRDYQLLPEWQSIGESVYEQTSIFTMNQGYNWLKCFHLIYKRIFGINLQSKGDLDVDDNIDLSEVSIIFLLYSF